MCTIDGARDTIEVMNTILILVGLGGFGLIFGSFVNALVQRIHAKRNWVTERSECLHCHHQLAPKDLIPVLSFVLLKGKCRYCGHKIADTPLAELAVPIIWILSYLFWPIMLQGVGLFLFIMWMVFVIGFVALAVYDLKWFLLPNKMVFPLIALAAVQVLVLPLFYDYSWKTVLDAGLAALLLSGMFYILFQVSAGTWIGGGDVKLAIVLGLLAADPLRACLLLFFASLVGTLASVPVMIKHGMQRKLKLPFGPLLIVGMILVQLFGSTIINWYVSLVTV